VGVGEHTYGILHDHGYDPRAAAELDPLGLDDFFMGGEFHAINSGESDPAEAHKRIGDVAMRVGHMIVRHKLIDPTIAELNYAAIRDVDMVLGSALLHGHRPVGRGGFMPGLGDLPHALVKLGAATYGVPRGTFYTYTDMNPGDRLRRFTNLDGEEVFIDALRDSSLKLGAALLALCYADAEDPDQTLEALQLTQEGMSVTVQSMVTVRRNQELSKKFGAYIQPFFRDTLIGFRRHFAPGGSQLPSSALTYILEGRDEPGQAGERARALHAGTYRYLPRVFRDAVDTWERAHGDASLRTLLHEQGVPSDDPRQVAIHGIRDLHTKFRTVHLATAVDSFNQRPDNARGSGGGTPGELKELTIDARMRRGIPRQRTADV
jgi:hypothetical protein